MSGFDVSGAKIAPGIYQGMLEKVEVLPSPDPRYPGDFRKWHFLLNVGTELLPITATSSLNTGTRSKSYIWLSAILGRALRAGEHIDDPVGKRVMITVADNEKGYSTIMALAPFTEPEQVVPGVPR